MKIETYKYEVETSLAKHQDQLETVWGHLKVAETKLVELQTQLSTTNEAIQALEAELHCANLKKEVAVPWLQVAESELWTRSARVPSLEEDV